MFKTAASILKTLYLGIGGCRRNRRGEGIYLRSCWITPSKKISDDFKILTYLASFYNSLFQYLFFCQQSYAIHILQNNLWQVLKIILFGKWVFFIRKLPLSFSFVMLIQILRSLFRLELGRLCKMIDADRNTKNSSQTAEDILWRADLYFQSGITSDSEEKRLSEYKPKCQN